jgi:hypothetical protein
MTETTKPAPQNSATIVNVSVSVRVAAVRTRAWTSAVIGDLQSYTSFEAASNVAGRRFSPSSQGDKMVSGSFREMSSGTASETGPTPISTGAPEWTVKRWSGQLDSNQRPAVPKTAALPGCAIPRSLEDPVDTRLKRRQQGGMQGRRLHLGTSKRLSGQRCKILARRKNTPGRAVRPARFIWH